MSTRSSPRPPKAPTPVAVERLASNLGALGFLIDMLSVQPAMAKSLFTFDAASGLLRSVVGGSRHAYCRRGRCPAPALRSLQQPCRSSRD